MYRTGSEINHCGIPFCLRAAPHRCSVHIDYFLRAFAADHLDQHRSPSIIPYPMSSGVLDIGEIFSPAASCTNCLSEWHWGAGPRRGGTDHESQLVGRPDSASWGRMCCLRNLGFGLRLFFAPIAPTRGACVFLNESKNGHFGIHEKQFGRRGKPLGCSACFFLSDFSPLRHGRGQARDGGRGVNETLTPKVRKEMVWCANHPRMADALPVCGGVCGHKAGPPSSPCALRPEAETAEAPTVCNRGMRSDPKRKHARGQLLATDDGEGS